MISPSEDDFIILGQIVRQELMHLLEANSQQKDLIIEKCLMKPLDKIASLSLLKKHGVDKIFQFDPNSHAPWGENLTEKKRRIYMIRPKLANFEHVLEDVKKEQKLNSSRFFTVVFVPRVSYACKMRLEETGFWGLIDVDSLDMGFVVLESDLLSLELPEFFVDVFVNGDLKYAQTAARALWRLQTLFGPTENTFALGDCADDVLKIVENQFKEQEKGGGGLFEPIRDAKLHFSQLFVFDRTQDLVSLLLTGLTYEGMLDDFFVLQCARLALSPELVSKLKSAEETTVTLSNRDSVFSSVRDRHISAVSPFLSGKAKILKESTDRGQESMSNVQHMKQFVSQELRTLKQEHKSLELHVGASELIMDSSKAIRVSKRLETEQCILEGLNQKESIGYVEDLLCEQRQRHVSLSLMCLLSVTQEGLWKKDFQSLRAQFLHSHGFKFLPAFFRLDKLALFQEKSSQITPTNLLAGVKEAMVSSKFREMCKKLNLLPKSGQNRTNLRDPTEMSYVFSGAYTPALCQLVKLATQSGIQLPSSDELRRLFRCKVGLSDASSSQFCSPKKQPTAGKSAMLVYFLGGVSYAEIAAIRLLAKLKGQRIVVATTNIASRERLFDHLCQL